MNTQAALEHRAQVEEFQRKHRIGLLTLLFTDIVGSTQLKQDLGDAEAVALIQRHHAVVREILGRFKEGEEIGTAGDSFFIIFAKPSDAVKFSLLLQAKLRGLAKAAARPVLDRIGIHVGEVFIEEDATSSRPKDLYGIQVDTCARVMSLAQADQILMTRFVFNNARQVLKGREIEGVGGLSWQNYGPYALKGVEEPLEICEVGEVGTATLLPPPNSDKARRHVSAEGEFVLGWRPALEQTVPGTQWVLEEKLGEGGFGEVWLGRHEALKERRVFKFCFRADRVRSLRREVTLFRVLKERIGNHPNIVGVQEVYFEEPPFYLVMDYAEGKNLKTWSEERGGVEQIPLATRLEIVAQVAEALSAAHSAGVIHRDVKPGNILISNPKSEIRNPKLEVKLTDFGIGQVVSAEYLAGITRAGFTQTLMSPGSSSQPGTQMYMAPELIAGKAASPQSDIFSLGVVLYQLVVGDLTRPLTMDWAKDISDPLLRDDLARCFAGNPPDRFSDAGQLGANLRGLETRRDSLATEAAALTAKARASTRAKILRWAALVVVLIVLTSYFLNYLFSRLVAETTRIASAKKSEASEYGEVEIESEPPGAEVWMNGQILGKTPYRNPRMTFGEVSFELKLAGYDTCQATVNTVDRKERTLMAFLRSRDGKSTDQPPHIQLQHGTFVLVELRGTVDFRKGGSNNWSPAKLNQVLSVGDQLRTGEDSRIAIRLPDLRVIRQSELTTIEFKPPPSPKAKPLLELLKGAIYLFGPTNEIRFKTPNASGPIRG